MPPTRALAVVVAPLVLAVAACGSSGDPAGGDATAADAAPLTVVASTDVYGSIARAVGGDLVTVRSIITDPAADPHSYESTPRDAATVAEADVVVVNGGGYDDFVQQLLRASDRTPPVVEAVELLPAPEAGGEEPNEHAWYSPPTVQRVATELASDLGTVDVANAGTYAANAAAFGEQVGGLSDRVDAIAAAHRGERVAATEPLPGHLLEQAGLVDATPTGFAEAVEEDADPPAAAFAETLALFSGDPVRALVVNAQTTTPTTDQVRQAAEAAGVPVVEMTETLPEGSAGYVPWMGAQIDALAGALGRT